MFWYWAYCTNLSLLSFLSPYLNLSRNFFSVFYPPTFTLKSSVIFELAVVALRCYCYNIVNLFYLFVYVADYWNIHLDNLDGDLSDSQGIKLTPLLETLVFLTILFFPTSSRDENNFPKKFDESVITFRISGYSRLRRWVENNTNKNEYHSNK